MLYYQITFLLCHEVLLIPQNNCVLALTNIYAEITNPPVKLHPKNINATIW